MYTQNLWRSTSVACVLLFFNLLRASEVFIPGQRLRQLTWQAHLKDREGGPRVHSCTHHSAVQLDPWPRRVDSQPPSALCFLPLSSSLVFTWTGHRYTKGPVCHQNQGSPGPAGARELGLCPAEDDPTSNVSYQLHPYWDAQRPIKMKRDPHWLALHSRSGDISFVLSATDLAWFLH